MTTPQPPLPRNPLETPLGVILAGGRATRMGAAARNGDKGLLSLGRETILSQVIRRLAPQVSGMALSANGDPARFAELGLPVLPDSLPDWPGPLAGVLAGLDWAAGQGASHIVTVAADSPFFPDDLVARLVEVGGDQGLALAASPSGRQPTFGLWPVSLREDLRHALQAGLRKVVLWTDRHAAGLAEFAGDDAFFNVNTPDDLIRARRRVMQVFGIVGYKNAGKTGLMERLVAEMVARGLTVSTLKHAHHRFDVDQPGKDSYRHRTAGAHQVLLASEARWALMTEMRGVPEPPLDDLISRLDPVDLVLVEGWKTKGHAKIEAHRKETGHPLLAPHDPSIRAIASDGPLDDAPCPVLDLNDTTAIADLIEGERRW